MARGRRRKPEALRRLAGYPGHSRPPEKSPIAPAVTESTRAQMPDVVRRDASARKEWERLAPQLELLGLLDSQNQQLFAAYCLSWSVYIAARQQMLREGFTYKSKDGLRKKHPAFEAMKSAGSEMRKFGIEFGITPASREKAKPSPQLPLPGVNPQPQAPSAPPEAEHEHFGGRPPVH